MVWSGTMTGEKGCPAVGKRVVPQHVERQSVAYDDEDLSKSATGASTKDEDVEINLSEVYFLIMHFLASGPCSRATGQLWNELLQHKLLPRRYHAWYSRSGLPSGDENDDGNSFPLSYVQVLERNPEIEKDHLVKLLKQQVVASRRVAADTEASYCRILTAADVPTLLGEGSFSLLDAKPIKAQNSKLLSELRWPHWLSSQVRGLALREISGGFSKHHRAPSIRAASYTILKPHVLVDKIQIIKKIRGHRNAVYCAIFDRTGQHIITGSDDRLVKFWSTETGFCLRSCRGHEGDITELSVSHGNSLVASASNDCTIRVWRLPDGIPVSVLRGHTGAVTAIAFRPRQSCEHHLLSSSDDGTCRIWDARDSSVKPRVYMPNPEAISLSAKSVANTQPVQQQPGLQISCCAFNADGSIFVTGSSDKFARVWDARKWNDEITGKPNYEMDVLKGHENAVNYVQFCGCAGPVKPNVFEGSREDGTTKFKNAWPTRDSIVTCSRDGSAIIWICKPRKKIARYSRWSKAYHLRVPPPPMPPHPPRVGGPRQRLLPTPRGVNMIVWSLDNRFVLAAIMDCRICVWNAIDGSLVHSLTGHTKSTFVVDVHPFNPRIAMSAGYDGRVIIWDIWEGQPVRVYETGDFQIVDGCFSPDGTSIVVSDEVGQFYLLTTGQGQSQKDAKFDQFFLGDFRPLVRDLQGNVLDQETQLPPHQRNIQDLLCDANMIPYQEPYQSMYQQRRLGALGIDWQPLQLNLAVGMDDLNYAAFRDNPIVPHPNIPGSSIETADYSSRRWVEQPVDVDEEVDWEQDLTRLTDDSGSDYSASEEILSFLEEIEEDEATASSSEGLGQSDTDDDDHASVQELRLRRSNRRKRKAEGHSHDHDERKIRKLPNNQLIDSSNKLRLDKTKLEGQSAFSKTSTKIASARQLGRPKRAAAANALQLFNNKELNDDGEDDDASSSHQDTSLYNDEEDAESDAQAQSSDKNDERDTCPEIDEAVEADSMEEISVRNRQKGVKVDKFAETKEEEQQVHEVLSKAGDKAIAVSEDGSSRAYDASFRDREGDKYFHYNEIYEGSLTAGMVPGELMTPASNESLQQEEPGRRLKSRRRLVVKVSKKVNDMVAQENKVEKEDPFTAISNRPLVDHLDLSKEQHKRRFRRLMDKAPVSSRHSPENLDDLSVTSDDENCSGVQHGTLPIPDNDDSLPPDEFGWPRKRLKEKGQSGFDIVPKYAERSGEAAASEPSCATPTSFSGTYHSPTNSGSSFDKTVGEAFPGAEEDFSNHEMDIDNGGIDWSGNSELQQDRVNSFERQADTVLCHRHMSSPDLSGKFPILSTRSPSSENPSEGQYGRPRPISCLESEINEGDMNMHAVCSRRIGSNHGKVKLGHEEQGQDVSEAVNPARGTISFRARKERENIAGEHDKVVFFPLSKEGHYRGHAAQSMGDLNYSREAESEERNAFRAGSGDAVPAGPEHTDESEPSLIGNHIDCESCHDDDASWSQSESERTLCEIGSANILSPKPEEDSAGTEKVQPMWPSMMDSVKTIRVKKGSRGKRAAVKKETEMCDEERKPQRLGVWTRKAAAFSHHQDKNAEEDLNFLITNHCAPESELHGRSSGAIGQWQAQSPMSKEKELRISSRNRKEMLGTLHRDQARQLNMSMMVRDRVARTRKSLAWLLQSEVEETRYVPQFGDKVVYLRQGHAEYLEAYHVNEPGPWTTYGADLSDTEICQVVGLEYTILPDSGETCCKFTLEFLDSPSLLQGETFWLRLPELINFPDFIIEKTRYDASIERRWTTRDKCKVWWRSQNGQGGGWWQGRVVAVKPKSMDFPESPWERFLVQYKSDPNKPYRHSPWELFDPNDAKWEQPHIDNGMKERLLMELESAANEPEDAYGFRKFRAAGGKSDFLNRLPLPLTLDVLIQRLKKDYYHSAQAFYFDVQLLASNAQRLCGTLHPMTQGLQSFAEELHTEIFSASLFHIQ